MKKQPLLSVIVPVYNTAPYLRRCLDSVCGQTYANLEIICVNDGSTDDSASILAEYAAQDARVKVISQLNAGASAARNAALKVATGEYVTGVDSDDYIELNAYQEVMQQLGERRVDIACYGFLVEEEDKTIPRHIYDSVGYHQEIDVEKITPFFWNKWWRREFLESLGAEFHGRSVCEDMVFTGMYAPYAKDFLFCAPCLYHYVQRGSSALHTVDYLVACRDRAKGLRQIWAFHQRKEEKVGNFNFVSLLLSEYEVCLSIAPCEGKRKVQQAFRRLCLELGLEKDATLRSSYPGAELARPWLRWNPFYRRDKWRKCYKLFWIPVFTMQRKKGYVRYKLLGIRIAKRPCLSDSW